MQKELHINSIKGYSTNRLIFDFHQDITDYEVNFAIHGERGNLLKLLEQGTDFEYISNSQIEIFKHIENLECGTYKFIGTLEKNNQKEIFINVKKTVCSLP